MDKKQQVEIKVNFLIQYLIQCPTVVLQVCINGDVQTSPEGKQNNNTHMPSAGFKLTASKV
jgi:hypothetical protein